MLTEVTIGAITPDELADIGGDLRELHCREWQRIGLCVDEEAPESRVDQFDARGTFVVRGRTVEGTEKAVGQINTIPVKADSIAALVEHFSTYAAVVDQSREQAAQKQLPTDANYRVCFSITADQRYRVEDRQNPRGKSTAVALLQWLGDGTSERKIAYSRVGRAEQQADPQEAAQQVLSVVLSDDSEARGAVGLHESLGGITVAIIPDARPEDQRGGGANVLVAYPHSPQEAQQFAAIRAARQANNSKLLQEVGHGFVFTDIEDLKI